MSEVTEFWEHNRNSAIAVAAIAENPYDAELKAAFDFFEQRARGITTSEGTSFYDVLHEAMKGNIKPNEMQTHLYAIHLPSPHQTGMIETFVNHVSINPVYNAVLGAMDVMKMISAAGREEARAIIEDKVFGPVLSQYRDHCNRILHDYRGRTTVLYNGEKDFDETDAGFEVKDGLRIPTALRYIGEFSTLECGFPNPYHLPSLAEYRNGINPYHRSVAIGAYVTRCLSYVPRFELGNIFGICAKTYVKDDPQQEREQAAKYYNMMYSRMIPVIRLLHKDETANAGVPSIDSRVILGFDLVGEYPGAISGKSGYEDQALLDCDHAIYPGKDIKQIEQSARETVF